jgi:hypothetical protein
MAHPAAPAASRTAVAARTSALADRPARDSSRMASSMIEGGMIAGAVLELLRSMVAAPL